jgi:hypothetical protein
MPDGAQVTATPRYATLIGSHLVVGGDDGASADFGVVQQLVGLARAVEREEPTISNRR